MLYAIGTKLAFRKQKITFIQLSTRRVNTREVMQAVKVKG